MMEKQEETRLWVISDSHFYHDNMVHLCGRPGNFTDIIIKNWHDMVGDKDTVIHLGDVIFKRRYELRGILEYLPGMKILTIGNHDKRTGTNDWFLRMGFNYVCKSYEYKNVIFSHRPIDISEYPNAEYNIHGHFHTNTEITEKTKEQYPFYSDKHILFCLEHRNYSPVLLRDLVVTARDK